MRRPFVRGLILAVLLLLAQQGALLHTFSHHAGAASTPSEGDDGRHAGAAMCTGCVAFAGVASAAAPSTPSSWLLDGPAFQPAPLGAVSQPARDAPPQRSRGPPTLL